MKRALKCRLNLAFELLIHFDSAKFSFSLKQLHHCSQAFFKHFTFFSIHCAYTVSFFLPSGHHVYSHTSPRARALPPLPSVPTTATGHTQSSV